MDTSRTIVPHKLCDRCRIVAGTYTPSQSRAREDTHALLEYHHIPMNQDSMISDPRKPMRFRRAFQDPFADCEMFWASTKPMEHHASVTNLRKSAERGCHLCSLFVGSIDRSKQSKCSHQTGTQLWVSSPRKPKPSRSYKNKDHDNRPLFLHDYYPCDTTVSSEPLARVQIYYCSKIPTYRGRSLEKWKRRFTAASEVSLESSRFRWSLNSGSDASCKLIAAWLKQCMRSHESCSSNFSGHLPSRLLDLHADLSLGNIRLVSTSDIGTHQYATLSYSWGDGTSVVLTDNTLTAFQDRIMINTLPKTIQNAIEVCRGVQMRYLWVDALCIIQGNDLDFATEVSRMGSTYANSSLTIAASDALDCSLGCFQDRHPLQVEDCQALDDGDNIMLFTGTYHDNSGHYLEDRHLDTRAWVYQERMMSPRTVHFCGSDVVWECREWLTCQRCAVSPQPSDGFINDGEHKKIFAEIIQWTAEELNQTKFEAVWNRILPFYTRTSLSNEDDRLSALAGMVELLNRYTNYESSFGLWLPFFLDQLLWYYQLAPRGAQRHQNKHFGIPSWSWASVQGSIRQVQISSKGQAHTYSAELTQAPPVTSFGQISSLCAQLPLPAATRLRSWATVCRPIPVSRRKRRKDFTAPDDWTLGPISEAPDPEHAAFERLTWNSHLSNTVYTDEQANTVRKMPFWRRLFRPDTRPEQQQHLVCLLIKRIWETLKNKRHAAKMVEYGLVLECVNAEKNQFKRRGVYIGYSGSGDNKAELKDRLREALESKDEHSTRLAREVYDTCTDTYESEVEQRIRKLFKDRYSLFDEDDPMIEVEII